MGFAGPLQPRFLERGVLGETRVERGYMDQMTEANLATLSRLVAEKGDGALPYPEEVKYGVKTHVAELIKVLVVLCGTMENRIC